MSDARPRFDPRRHRYTLGGENLPSITKVLQVINHPHLVKWVGRLGNEEADRQRDEAANRGTRIHAIIEKINADRHTYDELGQLGTTEELRPFAEAYLVWKADNVAEVLGNEQLVWSPTHRIAGTLDTLVRLHGDPNPVILDIKSSKGSQSHNTWSLQLAAYAVCLMESAGIVARRRLILALPHDSPGVLLVHELPMARLKADWEAFRAALALYRWLADFEASAPPWQSTRPAGPILQGARTPA